MTRQSGIRCTGRGPVSEWMREYAVDKVGNVVRTAGLPVLDARVVLTERVGPGHSPVAVAWASLDVNGVPVRAQATATGMREAIDRLHDVLRRRLRDRFDRLEGHRRRTVAPNPPTDQEPSRAAERSVDR